MVLSRLNNAINYPDLKKVDREDIDFNSPLYEIDIYGVDLTIALGNIKFTFVTKGVLYAPIYMVVKDKVVSQIGIFEFLNSDYTKLLDGDDDLDLNLLDPPLLYSFTTKEYITLLLTKKKVKPSGDGDEDAEESEVVDVDPSGDDGDDGDDGEDGGGEDMEPSGDEGDDEEELEELVETVEDAKNSMPKTNWVQKFLHNGNYQIRDTGGGGDCLFSCIREAFKFTGKTYSVDELRALIAAEVTQDTFDNYTVIYNDLLKEIEEDKRKKVEIKKKFNAAKALHKKHRANKVEAAKYAKQGTELRDKYNMLEKERKRAVAMIEDEFKMMKGLNTIDDFKAFIQTCDFWGDMWAISTLERILNIKLIILSSEQYELKNFKTVLQCGQLADNILRKDSTFRPQYYIILDFMGNHYKLITYKGRQIFTFKELPYGLVQLIVTRCMGKDGVFDKIPEFDKFKDMHQPLFDEDVVFQFYSKSQNKPPGKGAGEKITPNDVDKYTKLSKINNWRRTLSNFYIDPFDFDGKTWNTVEHLYQGSKFKDDNPEFYEQFSLGSGSIFSKDPVLAKAAGGAKGTAKIKGEKKTTRLRPTTIIADADFWNNKNDIMETALRAKFTQTELPRTVLKETQDAKLNHYLGRGKGTETWNHLMKIRKDI